MNEFDITVLGQIGRPGYDVVEVIRMDELTTGEKDFRLSISYGVDIQGTNVTTILAVLEKAAVEDPQLRDMIRNRLKV